MVADHFGKLGFAEAGPLDGGGTRWVLDLAGYTAPDLPMSHSVHDTVPA